MKILVVDDDPLILEILTLMASRAGYTDVSTALSGKIALDLLTDGGEVFDCLLLDINMPDMDGIELCRLARSISMYSDTPIIMLTAMTEHDHIDRAFKAGATDYASKPIDFVELSERLRMAQEAVAAQRKTAAVTTLNQRHPENSSQHVFDLSDEVQIKGIKDLISYAALGKYLTQLSRAGLGGSQVLAVKIDQIEPIYARASTPELLYTLTEVADAISDVLRIYGCMMAYVGNGVFIVVTNKVALEPSIGLETEIQYQLDEKCSEYDNGDPLDIEVSIGNPIRPNCSETQDIQKTLDRAIARAECRTIKKQSATRPVNIRRL